MYNIFQETHWILSRVLLLGGLLLFSITGVMGLQRRDVTPTLRRVVMGLAGLVVIQALIGLVLYIQGGRALEPDIHIVYGVGISFLLPFFIYVEMTAEKRPAIGSYIVGGILLFGLAVRSILTGG